MSTIRLTAAQALVRYLSAQVNEDGERHEMVKGFAIGRTIFGEVVRAWMAGRMADDEAVTRMAGNFSRLCEAWD